jgi:Leucine-rich repeat (LRR) protein
MTEHCKWIRTKKYGQDTASCYNIDSDNILQEVPNLSYPHTCKELIFQNSSIKRFPRNVFTRSKNVMELHIENSKINTIQIGAFSELQQVRMIYLQFNSLDVVPRGCFTNLPELKILDLSNNNIHLVDVDDDVFSFEGSQKLEEIFLNNNNIEYVPSLLFHSLKNLQVINLSFNNIKAFHLRFSNFNLPRKIHLNNNEIKEVNCKSFQSSIVITLGNNFLEEINGSCFPPSLERLILNNNTINKIFDIGKLKKSEIFRFE